MRWLTVLLLFLPTPGHATSRSQGLGDGMRESGRRGFFALGIDRRKPAAATLREPITCARSGALPGARP